MFEHLKVQMASYDWRLCHAGLMAIAVIREGTGKVCNHFTVSEFNGYSSRRSLSPSAVMLRKGDGNRKSVVGETGAGAHSIDTDEYCVLCRCFFI